MDMQRICEYLVDNINNDVNIDQLAEAFHYNKFYLMRKFKDYTGFTINEFVNECRVYNSTDPLIFTNNSVLKIALTNGFNSLEYYSEKFKDVIGTSPLRFRQIYSGLLAVAEKSENPEELKYIKTSLEELQEYQHYLHNIGTIASEHNNEVAMDKPKVKTLKSPFSKAA